MQLQEVRQPVRVKLPELERLSVQLAKQVSPAKWVLLREAWGPPKAGQLVQARWLATKLCSKRGVNAGKRMMRVLKR